MRGFVLARLEMRGTSTCPPPGWRVQECYIHPRSSGVPATAWHCLAQPRLAPPLSGYRVRRVGVQPRAQRRAAPRSSTALTMQVTASARGARGRGAEGADTRHDAMPSAPRRGPCEHPGSKQIVLQCSSRERDYYVTAARIGRSQPNRPRRRADRFKRQRPLHCHGRYRQFGGKGSAGGRIIRSAGLAIC